MPGRDGIPSVTEILSDVGLGWQGYAGLSADRLTFLRARGKAVHAALHWLATTERAPLPTLHDALVKPIAAYTRWALDTEHSALASELESIHSTKLYMGHMDRVGPVHGVLTLVDFKVTASPDLLAATYQLAGYYRLLTEVMTPRACAVVALNPETGDYRHHDLTERVLDTLHIFDAAVVVHHARRRT